MPGKESEIMCAFKEIGIDEFCRHYEKDRLPGDKSVLLNFGENGERVEVVSTVGGGQRRVFDADGKLLKSKNFGNGQSWLPERYDPNLRYEFYRHKGQ